MKQVIIIVVILFSINFIYGQSACPDGPSNKYKNLAIEHKGSGNIDAQAYSQAAMYEIGVCACLSGELYPEADVQGLKAKSEAAKSEAKRLKSGLTFRPWPSKCKFRNSEDTQVNKADNGDEDLSNQLSQQNFGEMLIGGEISDLAGGFVHGLAQYSDNPKIKQLSNEVGKIQAKYGEARSFNNQLSGLFGVNPADNEAMQIYEVAQTIEIGIAIAKSLFGETETPLSESQNQVLKAVKSNNRNLKLLYNEIASFELSSRVDSSYLIQLYRKEMQFEEYNAFTAADRYLYYWWVLSESKPDINDYNLEIKKIQGYTLNELLNSIYLLNEKLNYYNVKEPPHMANKNQAFASVSKQIELNKALYFKSINYSCISDYYLSKFIGVDNFSTSNTKADIREIIESNPSGYKITVTFSENEIAIKNLKKNGKIFSCYSIPLNQGEYEIENEVIFSTTYFHLNPKAYKSPIKFYSCEKDVYYETVQIMKTKESTIIGTQLQSAINSLVKYYQFLEFEENNHAYFNNAPVIQSLINQEIKHCDKKHSSKLNTGNIYISDKYESYLNSSNSKWGFANEAGEEVIEAKFQLVSDFSEGLACVTVDGDRYGFIDRNGEYVIPPKYQIAYSFKEGLAVVYYYGEWGFIDKNGNEVIPLRYDDAESFSSGLAAVQKGNRFGYINLNGEVVIPFKYSRAWSFSSGLAVVKKGNRFGYINLKGEEVIPIKYKSARRYDGKKIEVKKGKNWVSLDINGNELAE